MPRSAASARREWRIAMAEMHPDVESVVLSEEDIRRIVSRMGRQISED